MEEEPKLNQQQEAEVAIQEAEIVEGEDLTPPKYHPSRLGSLVGAVVFTVGFTLIPEAFSINPPFPWDNLLSVGEISAVATAGFLIGNVVGEILGGNSPTQN